MAVHGHRPDEHRAVGRSYRQRQGGSNPRSTEARAEHLSTEARAEHLRWAGQMERRAKYEGPETGKK